jgi:diguanylate cyclase (GGDEF)-like protein
MYSLFHSLLAQHSRQLTPVRCAPSTTTQLHRYFEDVVLENNLSSLVVESLPEVVERSSREIARLRKLEETCRGLYLMLEPRDAFMPSMAKIIGADRKAVVWDRCTEAPASERFVVIADARFSALLASVNDESDEDDTSRQLVIWTFEPDVVYSALEYLMARVTAEQPFHSSPFQKAVRSSMPKATSLQLTLGVTTKLARLLQEQAEREIAVNRIGTAIRNSLDLDQVLETAAREVGRALNVESCAVRVQDSNVGPDIMKYYVRSQSEDVETDAAFLHHLEDSAAQLSQSMKPHIIDGDHSDEELSTVDAVVPLIFKKTFVGVLSVRSENPMRIWAENELLLLHTVADQLAVAVNQAHLFTQTQQQALTDELTGCYNRRSFELQLQRDLHFAIRMRQPLSLIMIDVDKFKEINDNSGHDTGDVALKMFADSLRSELRAVDTAARFGGDEFVIILPQADTEGAMIVAERLRRRIQQIHLPLIGPMSASFGLATFPIHASSRDTLVAAADKALYESKYSGRNRVSLPSQRCEGLPEDDTDDDLQTVLKLVRQG